MGCYQGKPISQKNSTISTTRKSITHCDGYRSQSTMKSRSKKTVEYPSVIDYTMTLKQLELIRDGLQKMPIMPETFYRIDPAIEKKNKQIIETHQSGVLHSINNSKLFQRRKLKAASTAHSISCNNSFCSKQQ